MKKSSFIVLCMIFSILWGFGCSGGGGGAGNGGGDGTGQVSAPTKTPQNNPPIADAGSDQAGIKGATIQLDGSKSSDSDGDVISFKWVMTKAPQGGDASLNGADTSRSSFVIPQGVASVPDVYVIKLTVTDGKGASASDEVRVSVNNQSPVIEKVEYLSPNPVKFDKDLDVQNGDGVELKVTAKDPDNSSQPLTYRWVIQSQESLMAFNTGGMIADDQQSVKVWVSGFTGSYGEIKIFASDGLISAEKIISLQTWKRVVKKSGVLPVPSAIFVQNAMPPAGCTELGTVECPYGLIDNAFVDPDKDRDIYFLKGNYLFAGSPDDKNRSMFGGYEVVDGKWRKAGFGYKAKTDLAFSEISVDNSSGMFVSYYDSPNSIEVSGFSLKGNCKLIAQGMPTDFWFIDVFNSQNIQKNRVDIRFNKFENHMDGTKTSIRCRAISMDNPGDVNIFSNVFLNDYSNVPVFSYIPIFIENSGTSKINITDNDIEYPKNQGEAILLKDVGEVSIQKNYIHDIKSPDSNASGTRGICAGNFSDLKIVGNKIVLDQKRADSWAIHALTTPSLKSKLSVFSNLVVIPPDTNGSKALLITGVDKADIYNNTLVILNDKDKDSNSVLVYCDQEVSSLGLMNNIFYMGMGGNNDEKTGLHIGKTCDNSLNTLDFGRVRTNDFVRFGDGVVGNSKVIKDENNTIEGRLRELLHVNGNMFDVEPVFADGLYHLDKASPLINAGCDKKTSCDVSFPYGAGDVGVNIDMDGETRPYPSDPDDKNSNYDIGADEVVK